MPESHTEMQSTGELIMLPDADAARAFFREKSRAMVDKRMSVPDAVDRFIHDGDYLAIGGFGSVRIPTAVLHQIVRARRRGLGFAGHCSTHDFQILVAGHTLDRCDVSYVIGLEMRGLSPNARRCVQNGEIRTVEWSNAALGWRFKAAAMGVSFLPVRVMLGTDTQRFSAAKEITCPFTGQTYLAVPALFPDVAVIHVHQADIYGNAHIEGISIVDVDLAKAAKRLVITAERIVDTEYFRGSSARTTIPYWMVDAVCETPFGSYPAEMPYEYGSDEEHIAEWIAAEVDPASLDEFLNRMIYGTRDFEEYLVASRGRERMAELRAREPLKRSTGGLPE